MVIIILELFIQEHCVRTHTPRSLSMYYILCSILTVLNIVLFRSSKLEHFFGKFERSA